MKKVCFTSFFGVVGGISVRLSQYLGRETHDIIVKSLPGAHELVFFISSLLPRPATASAAIRPRLRAALPCSEAQGEHPRGPPRGWHEDDDDDGDDDKTKEIVCWIMGVVRCFLIICVGPWGLVRYLLTRVVRKYVPRS